ncbi:MAG: hypothetical protein LBD86_04635 [Spirochaetaceae bacterium]|nr:hypothetical protein [Spirochaetaceae bacterium]
MGAGLRQQFYICRSIIAEKVVVYETRKGLEGREAFAQSVRAKRSREAFAQSVRAKRSREAFAQGMEGQHKGLAWRNPAKPGFRHEGPEMRPNYMSLFQNKSTVR